MPAGFRQPEEQEATSKNLLSFLSPACYHADMTTNVTNSTGNAPDAAAIRREALVVLRGFAFAYANGRTYGLAHKITLQAMAMSEKALASFLSQYGTLEFAVDTSGFHVAGAPIDLHTAGLDALSARLVELGASGISFDRGITPADMERWFRLLSTGHRAPAGFQALLSSAGLARIHAANFAFRKVGKDEDVAKKAAISPPRPLTPPAPQGIRLTPPPPPRPAAPARVPVPDVNSPARQRNATPIRTARRLLDSLPPTEPLPPLKIEISETAIHRDLVDIALPPDAVASGRSPNDLATEAGNRLERLADGIMAHPANQTQTGRAALRKFLKEAASDLTERLQRLGADIQALERLAAKVRDLVEDLAVDGIVTRLVKLSGQMAADENRLVRRLRHADRVGGEEGSRRLQARLREAGLTEEMLQQLLDAARREKTAAGKGKGEGEEDKTPGANGGGLFGGQDSEAPSPLPSLLDQLKETDPGSGDLPHLIEIIIEEMNQTLLRTEERVRGQLRTLHSLMDGRSEKKTLSTTELTREELIRLMAELGQQLKQPLTVVTGAAQMIHSGYFGRVSKEEKTALRLINDSTDELDLLVERMIEIAHLPDTLKPEHEVIDKFKNSGKNG